MSVVRKRANVRRGRVLRACPFCGNRVGTDPLRVEHAGNPHVERRIRTHFNPRRCPGSGTISPGLALTRQVTHALEYVLGGATA